MNLLIVNNQQICRKLESMLKNKGYRVNTAHNGKEALALLQDANFDGLITGVFMPVMDGFQLCRAVRSHDRLKEIPIIFFTHTSLNEDDERLALALGADAFLQSADPYTILSHIENVLQAPQKPREVLEERVYLQEYNQRLKKKFDDILLQMEEIQKKLSQSERKYHRLFEGANDAIFIMDTEGGHIEANKKASELLGYTLEEFRELSFRDIVVPSSIPDSEGKLKELLQGKEIPVYEKEFTTKDNRIIPVEVSVSGIPEESGRIAYIQSTVRDITERKKAEEALSKSEKQYRNLFENASVGIYRTTPDGCILEANPALVRMLGYSSFEELAQRNLEKEGYRRGHRRSEFKKRMEQDGQVIGLESAWVRKDGTTLRVRENATAVRDDSGNILYYEGTVEDITEYKKAEEQIRESEQRYRNMIELAPEGIATMNLKGVVTSCNTAFSTLTGFSKDELVGKHFRKLPTLRARDIPAYAKIFSSVIRGKVTGPVEFTWVRKDGSIRQGEAHVSLMKKGNRIVGLQGIASDITERKKAEEMLRLSEEKYRTLIENLNVGVYRVTPDKEGQFIDVNQAFVRILGYTKKEDVLALRVSDTYVNPDDRKKFVERATQGSVKNEELHLRRKDGTPIIVSDTATPVYDTEGNLLYFDGIVEDITERTKIEGALRESEEKYRTLVETSKDSIVIIDLKGNVQFANRATEELTGYTRKEGLHMNVRQITPLRYWPKSILMLRKAMTGEPVPYFESFIKRKEGELVPVESGGQAIFKDGKVVGIQVITRDITQRKQAEEQIKASLREKEVLLQEIHHRVKNNMQIISSLLKLQENYIEDDHLLEVFRDSQNRIQSMALVHEKLYQSKDLASINFSEYIKSLAYSLFRSSRTDVGRVTLKIEVEDVSLGSNHAIPCGLIINELVSNCLKHAFPGNKKGGITINVCSRGRNEIELTVADDGVGIPEDIDFQNAESLGLRLVTILAENQLNGRITLDRTGGTTICITFRVG
jgi:PAS domain S-box-containing protein